MRFFMDQENRDRWEEYHMLEILLLVEWEFYRQGQKDRKVAGRKRGNMV